MEQWRSSTHAITVVTDAEVGKLPVDKGVWLLGQDNRLAIELFGRDPDVDVDIGADTLLIGGTAVSQPDHSTVIIRRHPQNASKAVGWISVAPEAAFPGVGSKLPHYGKYSYLAFEGDEPANTLKGEWAATDSPLRVDLRDKSDGFDGALQAARPPQRAALAELPPVFSGEQLLEHVKVLASEEMAGRGLGTPGLEMAADYIVEQFKAIGLQPGGDNGSYSQVFRVAEGEDGQPHDVRNIVGILPGKESSMTGQTLVVSAHYDHLGHGWPDERADAGDGVYYGADDNASGVAVMIELAKALADSNPSRSIAFVAFTGEEAGLLGSKHFVEAMAPHELAGVNAVVNMDTVGQLGDKPIQIYGGSTSSDWQHIFRGVGFTTGIQSNLITTDLASSDQQSFIDKGIPGIQISSGASLDYHRPSDTIDKVDGDGLVKVAMLAKEATVYLAERPEPLTNTIDPDAKPAGPGRGEGGSRRVSLGTVPDFAFSGEGVRIEALVPGSPGEQAGLQAGDVLVELAGEPVTNLQGYTDLLKKLEPGQEVSLAVKRGDEVITSKTKLVAR